MPVFQDDLGYVRAIVHRIHRGGHLYDSDEMESDGMLALMVAVEKWDEGDALRSSYSHDRKKYVGMCIRRRIIDGLRRRNGTRQEGQSSRKFDATVNAARLDAPLISGETMNLHDAVASVGHEDESIEDIDRLHGREKEVIQRTIIGDETLAMVATSWGVHLTRVAQIRDKAIDRISRERGIEDRRKESRHLTPREIEVLGRMADGDTNQEIANSCAMSIETVKTHILHILAKTEAQNRTNAVAIGFRQGVIH